MYQRCSSLCYRKYFVEFTKKILSDKELEQQKEAYLLDVKNGEYKREHNIDFNEKMDELDNKMNNLIDIMASAGNDPKIMAKYESLKLEKNILEAEFRLQNIGTDNAEIIIRRAAEFRNNILANLTDPEKTNLQKQEYIKLYIKKVEILNEKRVRMSHFLPCSSFSSQVEELNHVPREGFELST